MIYQKIGLLLLLGLSCRTLLWHLQNWQLREYRFDRIKAHTKTIEGTRNLFNLWFFKGLLPRPRVSGRIFMILGIWIFIQIFIFYAIYFLFFSSNQIELFIPHFHPIFTFFTLFVFWERTIFISIALAIFLSKIPVFFAQKILFKKAKSLIDSTNKNIIRIGITGSFGKSSTKEILVHLLQQAFGKKAVLFSPENQNIEISIARLILKNKTFFTSKRKKKFFICEMGAYRKGEIKKICDFVSPHLGIITGLGNQHIALFGSQKNIQHAKFELAEAASQKVFFNANNKLLAEIFADREISAVKIPINTDSLKISEFPDKSKFLLYGKKFTLPWPGKFFIQNAVLSLECTRELGVKKETLPDYLKKIKPLSRSLQIEKFGKTTLLKDLYSANRDGVKSALSHLKNFSGKKLFIGIPLLELGKESNKVHQEIFEQLADLKADVFWFKKDFATLGKKICGSNFHFNPKRNQLINLLQKKLKKLGKDDAILLESRLPKEVLTIFKKH